MHRCYLESAAWRGSEVQLSAAESHHLVKVLRAVAGDEVFVFDGAGRTARARLKSLAPAVLEIIREDAVECDGACGVTLIQALPKGSRMDLIVEKATELGVSAIVPVITERVIVEPKSERVERWRRIVVSASKQCGAAGMPMVMDITPYSEALARLEPFDLLLVGSLGADAILLRDVLRGSDAKRIGVIIGPEGDLTSDEIDEAVRHGAVQVSFGDLVLRVETAALYVLSAVRYEIFCGSGRAGAGS